MLLHKTSLPRVLVAEDCPLNVTDEIPTSAETTTVSGLAAKGVARIVCIGGLPAESGHGLPWTATGSGTDEPTVRWLMRAVELLQAALAVEEESVSEAVVESGLSPLSVVDEEPGESSDEEGGSADGIRLRVRVARESSEKWGITWHANIFKVSHRLVVKDIAEDSVLAKWNEGRPERQQVGYGDSLLRINGVRFNQAQAVETADKMRAELKRPTVRALFWRPGGGSVEEDTTPQASEASRLRSVVIVFGSSGAGGSAAAAAAVAAHTLVHGNCHGLRGALQQLGEVGALLDASRASSHLSLIDALHAIAGGLPGNVCVEASLEDRPSQNASAKSMLEETGEATVEITPHVEESQEMSEANETGEEQTSIEGQASKADPQWTYSCRRCGTALFHDTSILPHFTDGAPKASRAWAINSQGSQEEDAAKLSSNPATGACTSIFVEPMKWMGDLTESTGKLACGNPRCRQKLGGYCWHGLPCSCGQWQSPAFQIHCARIESMPIARRLRGGPPQRVFNE